jgi:hypothetical protein
LTSIPLDLDKIKALLKERELPEQVGPIRFYDLPFTCASRGCRSTTYIKVQGVPLCMMHALKRANELLVKGGESMSEQTGEDTPQTPVEPTPGDTTPADDNTTQDDQATAPTQESGDNA